MDVADSMRASHTAPAGAVEQSWRADGLRRRPTGVTASGETGVGPDDSDRQPDASGLDLGTPVPMAADAWRMRVRIANGRGLHTRPASQLVRMTSAMDCAVTLTREDGHRVDAKSILQLMSLAAEFGSELVVETVGAGAEEACRAVGAYLQTDEDDPGRQAPASASPH